MAFIHKHIIPTFKMIYEIFLMLRLKNENECLFLFVVVQRKENVHKKILEFFFKKKLK